LECFIEIIEILYLTKIYNTNKIGGSPSMTKGSITTNKIGGSHFYSFTFISSHKISPMRHPFF